MDDLDLALADEALLIKRAFEHLCVAIQLSAILQEALIHDFDGVVLVCEPWLFEGLDCGLPALHV